LTALIRYRPHGAGILDRNKRDGAVLVLGDTMKSASVWSDMSGRGNHGLVYGAGTPPAATPGALGYIFDGVDDYVAIGTDFGSGGFALGARRDINTISLYVTDGWVDFTYTVNINTFYHFAVISDVVVGKTYIYINGVYVGETIKVLTKSFTYSVWALSLSVTTSDRERIFNRNAANDFRIGFFYNEANAWNGSIDEVRIFNRALSATEIKRLYERTRILFGV